MAADAPMPDETLVELDEVRVEAEQALSYQTQSAFSATRTDTPLVEVPQSVLSIDSQILRDQGAFGIADALRNAAGVVRVSSFWGTQSNTVSTRGFTLNDQRSYFRDGFRYLGKSTAETFHLDKVEVLRGPSSVLYGRNEPGGIVNLVTKRPLTAQRSELVAEVGSFDFYRASGDFTGPIDGTDTLFYRISLAAQDSGSYRDLASSERLFMAPTLSWNLSPNTTLIMDAELMRQRGVTDYGIPLIGDRPLEVGEDPGASFGFDWHRQDYRQVQTGFLIENRPTDWLTLRNGFRFSRFAYPEYWDSYFYGLSDTPQEVTFSVEDYPEVYTYLANNTELTAHLGHGNFRHTVLGGLALESQERALINGGYADVGSHTPGNFPEIGADIESVPGFSRYDSVQQEDAWGIFLQDQVAYGNWRLMLGGRYDSSRREDFYHSHPGPKPEPTVNDWEGAFTPRAGINYMLRPDSAVYYGYSRSYYPSYWGNTFDGSPLEPEEGVQHELGFKTTGLVNNLQLTVAVFDLRKTNVPTPDLINGPEFVVQAGELASTGVEIDAEYRLNGHWNVIGSFAAMNPRVTESQDPQIAVGNQLAGSAHYTGSLWSRYGFQSDWLRGFGIGGGLFAVSQRAVDLQNTAFIPGYVRFDGALYYTQQDWELQLNVYNLLDTFYYESAVEGRTSAYPGAPLSARLSVTYRF